MSTIWKFKDAPDVGVIAVKQVMSGADWIQYVFHDEEDGVWQFHGTEEANERDIMLVSLQAVVALDPSLEKLADLPPGWQAYRANINAPWKREAL